ALRLFVLRVDEAADARRCVGRLPITSGAPWDRKPDSCVNVAFTHEGLAALGVPAESLASFPEDFTQGAAARASIVGDTGNSAPANWKGGLAGTGVHILVLLFAKDAATRDAVSADLRALWGGALS